jgi:membrane associated rhomboid family serine protease
VIPISDSVRARSFPYVNVAIIMVNIFVFMYEVYLSGEPIRAGIDPVERFLVVQLGLTSQLDLFIFDWANIPACTFDALGNDPALTRTGEAVCDSQQSPLATLFSSMFLHGGTLHLAGNMLFLWIFGDNVEDAMGHVRYLVFYLLVGVIATLVYGLTDMDATTPLVGASGAISGVMAAYLVLFPWGQVRAFPFFIIPIPAYIVIGVWFVMQLVSGVASLGPETVGAEGGVAYFAHIGGFVAGLLLVTPFMVGRRRPRQPRSVRVW